MSTGVKRLEGATLRSWRVTVGAVVLVPFLGFLAAVVHLWGEVLRPADLLSFLGFYLFTGFGITVGYHRLFTHRGFVAVGPLRWLLAVAGSMAVQGPILRWAADHRRHHRHSDQPGDPHSPHVGEEDDLLGLLRGFAWAHLGWFFDAEKSRASVYAPDLLRDPLVRRVDRLYPLWIALSLGLPTWVGWLATGSADGALRGLLFAGFARVFFVQHVTWSVNSVCHLFGSRGYRTRDESRNHRPMAILALGEGWHNNHHAFPGSPRHGLDRGQWDPSWWLIRGLERLGLVREVRLPSPAALEGRRR